MRVNGRPSFSSLSAAWLASASATPRVNPSLYIISRMPERIASDMISRRTIELTACKALNMPMEYNLHDRFLSPITHRKSYPDADFFDIVRQEGVRVLIGLDAHEPEEIRNPAQWDRAMKELEPFGALREDHLEL